MMERIKVFIADIARPYSIISLSTASSAAVVIVAHKVDGFEGAALFIGAAMGGVAALYGAKAAENSQTAKHAANVEIAKAAGPVPVVDTASLTMTTTTTEVKP
jgi:hypothetical protein